MAATGPRRLIRRKRGVVIARAIAKPAAFAVEGEKRNEHDVRRKRGMPGARLLQAEFAAFKRRTRAPLPEHEIRPGLHNRQRGLQPHRAAALQGGE